MQVGIPETDVDDKVLGGHRGRGLISGWEVVENDCRESRGDATDVRGGGGGEGIVYDDGDGEGRMESCYELTQLHH